jgi:UDPglucose 6-dehydrogenase/GDP-mannose 6-dehydrogenase
LEAALEEVDAVVLVTCWNEFHRVPEMFAEMKAPPLVVDGRRMLDKRGIARYAGIGL